MTDATDGTPPATPDNVVEKLAATFTMEYLTGHYRLLRDDEQRSFDQLRVIMLAFFAESCKALRAEVAQLRQRLDSARQLQRLTENNEIHWMRRHEAAEALLAQMTQERDKWLHNFNASEQYQSGPTKRAEAVEARLATLTEKVTEYETRPWPGCRMLSLGDACDCSLCEHDRKMAALTAVLGDMEQQCRSEIVQTLKNADEQTRLGNRTSATFWAGQASVYAFVADRLAALRTPEGK